MNKEMMSKGMKHNECRWIKDRLVFYSDDELPDDEHERASVEFLATVPGLEEYRNRAEDYLVMHYSKPPTGRQPGDIPKEAPQSESLDP